MSFLAGYSGSAVAAECRIEADGALLRGTAENIPQLVDPRCLVHSSSAATTLSIMDGRFVEESLGKPTFTPESTEIAIIIRAVCAGKANADLVRAPQATAEVTITKRYSVGLVKHERRPVKAYLICGPISTHVAATVGNLARFVVTYSNPGHMESHR